MTRLWTIALAVAAASGLFGISLRAAPAPDNGRPLTPPTPPGAASSPIDFFRRLLALSAPEREPLLATRSPQARTVLEAKLKEFDALSPAEREARLQTMHLRWLLLPLMKLAPDQRAARLAAMTPSDRALIEERLQQWDTLPPDLQQKVLANEALVRVFFRAETNAPSRETVLTDLGPAQRAQMETNLAAWAALSEEERQQVQSHVRRFFELSDKERERTLNVLSEAERKQMEQTLRAFARLPKDKRDLCLRGFQKFAGLSPEEQAEFLRNAERWQAMSPQDRQLWRDLVAKLQHRLPPLPPGLKPKTPPLPPGAVARPSHPPAGTTAQLTN